MIHKAIRFDVAKSQLLKGRLTHFKPSFFNSASKISDSAIWIKYQSRLYIRIYVLSVNNTTTESVAA